MRKVTQRITALALASAVAFSVLPTAAFAEASLDAASTAVQAEAEPEAQPVPEQASTDAFVEAASSEAASSEAASSEAASSEAASSEAASSEAASSEAASSEAASSEAASSEAASSEAASSEAASSEAASSEAASSEAASSEAASSEAASSEAASSEITADQPLKTASLLNTLANKEYSLELKDGQTTQKAIYETLGGKTVTGFGITSPKESFKINGTTIGAGELGSFNDSIQLPAGTHTVKKLNWKLQWEDYGTLTVTVYHELSFAAENAPENTVVFTDPNGAALTSPVKCDHDATYSFKVADISNYTAAVTLNGTALKPNADGVYTINVNASGEVKAVYTLSNGIKFTAADLEHIQSITVNGHAVTESAFQIVGYGSEYTVVITPEEGYALTEAKLGDETVTMNDDGTGFDANTHAFTLTETATAEGTGITNCQITAKAAKPFIQLKNENGKMDYLPGMSKTEIETSIRNALGEIVAESLPTDLQYAGNYTVTYKAGSTDLSWKPVDYEPNVLEFTLHAFGDKGTTEQVRIAFAGNARYPGVSAEFTVDLTDPRDEVKMVIDNGYTVKYKADHDEMDAFVAQQRTQHVQMLDENGQALPDADFKDSDFTFEYKHAAGEQDLTVTFKGNKKYKPATATGKILVTKGDAAVTVHSQTILYGESFTAPIFTADPAEAGVVGLIGGVKADGGLFVGLDGNITLNQLLGTNIPSITLPGIGTIGGDTLLKSILMKDEFKLSELTSVIQKILDAASIGGVLPGNAQQVIKAIQDAIDLLEKAVPGISNAVISLNYPTEAGIYTAVGFTTSQNYETAIGTGMLVIKQACASVTVNSQVIKYGETLQPVFRCTPAEANGVGIIAGPNTSGGYYVGVTFCNPKMQTIVNGQTTTLKELASVLEKVPEADTTGLNSAVSVLSKIMPGIENTKITFDDDPTEAGIYTAVCFTTNKNYQVAPVFGSIVIGQDHASMKLVFNQELPANKTLAVSEAKAFNFGGKLEAVSRALPTIGVNASYVGVKSNGRPYVGSTPCYEPGRYTETVYLVGTNYTACPISRCYTIINDQVMVYPVDAQKVYGDPDPEFEIEVITNNGTPERVLAKDYPGVSVVRVAGENVGNYDLSIQLDRSLLNKEYTTYRIPEDKKAQLVITQREVTMQFEDATIVYGEAAPAAKYQFLRGGEADTVLTAENFATELPGAKIVLLNSENQIVTDTTKLDAGIYTYTVLYTPEGCNFKLTVEDGTLIVAPRDIIVQFKDASIVYGDATPAAEYQFLNESTGEVDTVLTPDNFAAEVPGAQIVLMNSKNEIVTDTTKLDAGEYHYTVSNLPEASNYLFTIQGGKLTVAPRSIYLQVKDASMTEGESFPAVEFSFFEADEKGKKLDAVADWMSDELAETKIAVAYADATQGPKLSAGQYDMSFDQIAFADAAAASNAKVAMSVTGLYDNTNYDVNLFTLNEEHTKLATLTVNKKPSSGGNHSSSSSNKGSDSDNNNAAEEQSAVQQIAAVQPASVQTGDNSSLLLNLAVLLASVLGLVVILRKKI